jgi:hypothetical protein
MQTEPTNPTRSRIDIALTAALLLAAAVLSVSLCIRTHAAEDLGYHLAFGERTLQTGEIVTEYQDHIYLLPDPNTPAGERPEPGPGCRYDEQGRYRFVNANWGTQVLLALAYRAGKWNGITAGVALAVLLMVGFAAAGTWRVTHSWPLAAGAGVLVALTGYPRFLPRPELLTALLLAVEVCILLPHVLKQNAKPISWPALAGLVLVQILLVNVHSYFLLSFGLTVPLLLGSLLDSEQGRTSARRVAILVAAQVGACFAHPDTWRAAVLPFQTLWFLRVNHITDASSGHPWSIMADLRPGELIPSDGWSLAAIAFLALTACVLVAVIGCIRRRQWAGAMILVGFFTLGMRSQRNIPLSCVVLAPVALASLRVCFGGAMGRVAGRVAGGVLIVGCIAAIGYVCTGKMYTLEGWRDRFGLGLEPKQMPIAAAEWINTNLPDGRIWTDHARTSNLHFLTRPHRPMPLITNTWAYPPESMRRGFAAYGLYGEPTLDAELDACGVDIVVTRVVPLAKMLLARSQTWRLAKVAGPDAIFVRRSPARTVLP